MEHYISLLVKAVFVENMALAFFLGMCTFLAISKKIQTSLGLGIAVVVVLAITVPVNNLIYTYLLKEGALAWAGEEFAQVDLSFLGTWTREASTLPFVGADEVDCAGLFGQTCGEPTPQYKWTSRASFIDGPLTTSVRWRHLSSVDDDDDGTDYSAFNGVEKIDSYDLIDLTFSGAVTERATLTFGVTNLFDTLPGTPEFDAAGIVTNRPNSLLLGDNQEQANTYPSTYDVLGRRFFVSADFRF